ncbi:MAG: LytR C-terminal domain-containing protein [Deltaproteobacteria bacterium]|nr:LytR C-terminal domain-containing protein [Deltaproteobacteria bacterium]
MGRKIKINKAIGLTSVMMIFTGIIYGCYSRDVAPEVKNIYGQNIKPKILSEEELRKFASSIRKVDGEADAHYRLALYFQERRRHKLAIDELKQVLVRDPVNAKAYNAVGVSCDNLGDNDAAMDYYKLALKIDSKLDYVYNNLGYSYLLKNDIQNAVDSFQQAISLNEKEKRYRNNLGLAYARQGKFELAFDQFKILDSDANAEKMLAVVMKDIGKGAEAEAVLLAVRNAPRTEAVAKAAESTEIRIAAVQPQSEQADGENGIKEEVKSGAVLSSAIFQPLESGNPAQGERTIQIHEIRVLDASLSTRTVGRQADQDGAAVKEIVIAVENGNGVRGAAGKVAEHLRQNGFTVVKVSDAKKFSHLSTKIFYDSDNLKEVQRLLEVIPESQKSAELYKKEKMGSRVRLIIGKDLVQRNASLTWNKDSSIQSRIGG